MHDGTQCVEAVLRYVVGPVAYIYGAMNGCPKIRIRRKKLRSVLVFLLVSILKLWARPLISLNDYDVEKFQLRDFRWAPDGKGLLLLDKDTFCGAFEVTDENSGAS